MKTRRPERHNLLIALAVLMIAASVAAYCLMFFRWLGEKPGTGPFTPRAAQPAPEEIAAARANFRENFLDPIARLRLSETLYAHGRWVDAFYVMREARQFFGDTVFKRAHERVVLHKDSFLGDTDFDGSAANAALLEARLKEAPADVGTLSYLARIRAEQGQANDALTYADQGLGIKPGDPGLMLLKAEVTYPVDLMGSIPLYARLVNVAPSSPEARRALETLSRLAQKKDADPQAEAGRLAQEALRELYKAQPKEPLVFASLALSAFNRGDVGTARALVAETLRKDAKHAGALMVDAVIANSEGDTEKAAKEFSQAWEANPNDLYSAAQLARLYDRDRGDREAALPYYIAIYRENPDYAEGEPAEQLIQEILDARRKALLERVSSDSLSRYLSSDDGSLRAEACARAAALTDARWLEPIAELLDDDTDIVRHNADYALYQLALKQPDLIRVHKDEWLASPRPLLRTRALNLFADLYNQETFPAVAAALRDTSPTVRFLTKVMILDHYYKDAPPAERVRSEYLSLEKDPAVLALYARMGKP